MKTKFKFFIAIFSAVLIFTSCNNFLTDNLGFKNLLEEEVHDSTAKVLNVNVQAIAGQGIATSTAAEMKLNVTFMVSFDPDASYGYFSEWKAYANYGKDDQKELGAEDILFSNPRALTTEVTILKEYADIRILPICITHPKINFQTPVYGFYEAGTISPFGATTIAGDEPITVTAKMNDLYSFSAWEVRDENDVVNIEDYFNVISDSVSGKRADATIKLEIKSGVSVNGLTITANTLPRPSVRATSPAMNATSVSRTAAITIVFTKPLNKNFISAENYKNYFKIERLDSMISYEAEEVFNYFQSPKLSGNNQIVTFEPADKLNEANWLSPTSYVIVSVKGDLQDSEGILLGNDYVFSFTFGTTGDIEGPIVSDASLTFKNADGSEKSVPAASSTEAYWGDWMPNAGMTENHSYADSFRIKAAEGQKFSAQMTASDETTGNTGVKSYSVIQRLMYVSRGGRLPDTTRTAETDMTFFASDGSWNGLSGFLKADFEKEMTLEAEGDGFKDFEFASFKDAGGNYVDGIYMFELTARDGLGNKSGNPARYFVVRDNTAPDVSENAAKISFASCGIDLYGKKYFGGNYKTVKFKFNGSLTDIGTQGQPWAASRPADNKWSVALSASATEFVKATDWTAWKGTSEVQSIELSDSYFKSLTEDAVLYAWVKVSDSVYNAGNIVPLGNGICYVDVTPPEWVLPFSDYVLNYDSKGDLFLYKKGDSDLTLNCQDKTSGVKSIFVGEVGSLTQKENDVEISFENNKRYSIKILDNVENEQNVTFTVDNGTGFHDVSAWYNDPRCPMYLDENGNFTDANPYIQGTFKSGSADVTLTDYDKKYRKYAQFSLIATMGHYEDSNGNVIYEDYDKGIFVGDPVDKNGIKFYLIRDYFHSLTYGKSGGVPVDSDVEDSYAYVRSYKIYDCPEGYYTFGKEYPILKSGTVTNENINYIPIDDDEIRGNLFITAVLEVGFKNPNDYIEPEHDAMYSYQNMVYATAQNKVKLSPTYAPIEFVGSTIDFDVASNSCKNPVVDKDGNKVFEISLKEDSDRYKISELNSIGYGRDATDKAYGAYLTFEGDSNRYLINKGDKDVYIPSDTKITLHDFYGNSTSYIFKKTIDATAPKINVEAPYTSKYGSIAETADKTTDTHEYWYYEGCNGVKVSFDDEHYAYCTYTSDYDNNYTTNDEIMLTAKDWKPVAYTVTAYDFAGNKKSRTVTVRKDTNNGELNIVGVFPHSSTEAWRTYNSAYNYDMYYPTVKFYGYADALKPTGTAATDYEKLWDYDYDLTKFKTTTNGSTYNNYDGKTILNSNYNYALFFIMRNSVGVKNFVLYYPSTDGVKTLEQSYDGVFANREVRNFFTYDVHNDSRWSSGDLHKAMYDLNNGDTFWIKIEVEDWFGRKRTATKTFVRQK